MDVVLDAREVSLRRSTAGGDVEDKSCPFFEHILSKPLTDGKGLRELYNRWTKITGGRKLHYVLFRITSLTNSFC